MATSPLLTSFLIFSVTQHRGSECQNLKVSTGAEGLTGENWMVASTYIHPVHVIVLLPSHITEHISHLFIMLILFCLFFVMYLSMPNSLFLGTEVLDHGF